MTMTMFYVHGVGVKQEFHINIPAVSTQQAFDMFKSELGEKVTVAAIVPLFDFEYEEKKIVEVLN